MKSHDTWLCHKMGICVRNLIGIGFASNLTQCTTSTLASLGMGEHASLLTYFSSAKSPFQLDSDEDHTDEEDTDSWMPHCGHCRRHPVVPFLTSFDEDPILLSKEDETDSEDEGFMLKDIVNTIQNVAKIVKDLSPTTQKKELM